MSRVRCTLGCSSSDGMAYYPDGLYCHACKRTKKNPNQFPKGSQDVIFKPQIEIEISINATKEYYDFLDKWKEYNWLLNPNTKPFFIEKFRQETITYSNLVGFPIYYYDSPPVDTIARNVSHFGPKWLKIFMASFWETRSAYKCPYSNAPQHMLFITEDIISSFCLTDFCASFPLLGTSVKTEELLILARQYSHVILWLDDDKAGIQATNKISPRLEHLFKKVTIVRGMDEPKNFQRNNLKRFVKGLTDDNGYSASQGIITTGQLQSVST